MSDNEQRPGREGADRGRRGPGSDRRNHTPRRDVGRDGAPRREWKPREGDRSRDGAARGEGRSREGTASRDGGDGYRGGRTRDDSQRTSFPRRGGSGRERPFDDRPRERAPEIPEEVTARDLHPSARNELKTLSKENAEQVARHLAMAAQLIDDDPQLAHEHALAASRRAGRIAVVHESLAITAYATGDFALALRELRTYRRISGRDDQIALMVDSERGIGRPDRALELGRSVDRTTLPVDQRVALAIAMSGARLDRGETQLALGELEIPELDPNRAFEWSPALFAARATVHEDLGEADSAAYWARRAEVAAAALASETAADDEIVVEDVLPGDAEATQGSDEDRV